MSNLYEIATMARNAADDYMDKVAAHVTPEMVEAERASKDRFLAEQAKSHEMMLAANGRGASNSAKAQSRAALKAKVQGIPGNIASGARDAGSYIAGTPGRVGASARSAGSYLKANKGKAGLIAAGLATVGAGAGYMYNQQKTASEMIWEQKEAAEDLYAEALDKIAFAEELYEEADYAEKIAAGITPEMVEAERAAKARYAAENVRSNEMLLAANGRGASNSAKAQSRAALKAKVQGIPGNIADSARSAGNYVSGIPGRVGASARSAGNYLAANKGKAGLIAAGLATVGAGAGYAYNQSKTAGYDEMDEYDEVAIAKEAAEIQYADALDKLAFAEQLYMEADHVMKFAADNGAGERMEYINQYNTPAGAALSAVPTAAGAVIGAMSATGKSPYVRGAAAVAGGLLGAGVVAAGTGALQAFVDQHRMARAQEEQQRAGMPLVPTR